MLELAEFKHQKELEARNKKLIQHYWDGKWNKRSPEILDELQTPDVIYHGTSMNMNGIEEYKQVYGMYLSAMGESHIKVEKLIAEGDFVMSQARIQSIQNGPLGDIPPTGNEITLGIFTVFRLVDGKIAEEREIMDELAMMTQLGFELVPSNK